MREKFLFSDSPGLQLEICLSSEMQFTPYHPQGQLPWVSGPQPGPACPRRSTVWAGAPFSYRRPAPLWGMLDDAGSPRANSNILQLPCCGALLSPDLAGQPHPRAGGPGLAGCLRIVLPRPVLSKSPHVIHSSLCPCRCNTVSCSPLTPRQSIEWPTEGRIFSDLKKKKCFDFFWFPSQYRQVRQGGGAAEGLRNFFPSKPVSF